MDKATNKSLDKPLHPRYVMKDGRLDNAEEKAVEALRLYRKAQTNPALRAELEAWELLQLYVNRYRDGETSYAAVARDEGEADAPAIFAAVVTIAGLLPLFAPDRVLPDATVNEGSKGNG